MFPRSRHAPPPSKSVTIPPASVTSTAPAAESHGESPSSKKPSKIPEETYARSSAALPARRIDCASRKTALKTLR